MNRQILLFLTIILIGAVQSCDNTPSKSSDETIAVGENSKNSLDWAGVYAGVLPCADCEGIQTMLQLNKDQTFVYEIRHLGKSTSPIRLNGTFDWSKSENAIGLKGLGKENNTANYAVGENKLMLLDEKGEIITGELASKYILNKDISGIAEKYWKLTEVDGMKITSTEQMTKEPYMTLKAAERKVIGHGGCNSFSGGYELSDGNRIKFSKMISTKMHCANMPVEDQLFKTLEATTQFSINKDTLILKNETQSILARFEGVYLK